MAKTLYQDVHEPEVAAILLRQMDLDLKVTPLNSEDPQKPDWWWQDLENKRRGWSRKQLGEAIGDLDAVEDQINRELSTCDEYTLVIEGVGLASANGYQPFDYHGTGDFCHRLKTKKPHFCEGYFYRRMGLAVRFEGFKDGLRKAGVDVVETQHLQQTIMAIAAAFNGSWKSERTTLKRYLRPHIPPHDTNIHIDNLVRLRHPDGTGVGVVQGTRLVHSNINNPEETFIGAVNSPKATLIRMLGAANAKRFMKALGRE